MELYQIGKLENTTKEMENITKEIEKLKINIPGISEMKWTDVAVLLYVKRG